MELSANERRVLDMVWRRGPIARSRLAVLTDLTPASVTRIVQSLFDHGLIVEFVDRNGARGQPSRPIAVRPEGAHAIGVYFSHRSVEIGLCNLAGAQLQAATLAADQATPDNVARLIRDFTASVEAPGFDRASLCGVGIALPGDFIRGADLINPHAYFPDLRSPGSVRRLAEGIELPVFVENDAASAALGERLMGAGQGIDDFLFVHLGHGIGGALVQGGSLYRGVYGNAGMIGIRFPNDRPRPSGQDLFAHLAQAGIEVTDFPELEKLTATDCPPLKAWIRRAGAQLREELALTARVLDPAAIIIGGRLPLAMLNALVSEIDTAEFCDEGVGLPRPRVLASQLGIRAGMIGAASLPIVRLLMGRGAPHDERDLPGLALDRPA